MIKCDWTDCPNEAITALAGVRMCGTHYKEYSEEGRQHLPENKRLIWATLRRNADKREAIEII